MVLLWIQTVWHSNKFLKKNYFEKVSRRQQKREKLPEHAELSVWWGVLIQNLTFEIFTFCQTLGQYMRFWYEPPSNTHINRLLGHCQAILGCCSTGWIPFFSLLLLYSHINGSCLLQCYADLGPHCNNRDFQNTTAVNPLLHEYSPGNIHARLHPQWIII